MYVRGLKTFNISQNCIGNESDLIRAKSKGYLTYPDTNLYNYYTH